MGVSTDALLYYGAPLGDEDDAESWWEKVRPTDPEQLEEFEDDPTYWIEKHVLAGQYPVKDVRIGIHCSYDYPMYFVYIEESMIKAWRGYPKAFNPRQYFHVGSTWNGQLRNFFRFLGIEDRYTEPKWTLASLWG